MPVFVLLMVLPFSFSTKIIDEEVELLLYEVIISGENRIKLQVFELINNHIFSLSLNRLNTPDDVKGLVRKRIKHIIKSKKVSHVARSEYLKAKVDATSVLENVAFGNSSSQSVFDADFMHR